MNEWIKGMLISIGNCDSMEKIEIDRIPSIMCMFTSSYLSISSVLYFSYHCFCLLNMPK